MARTGSAPPPRQYRSPLRAQQARQTKELILDAFANLVIARGVSGATMAAVAERAGVAERTVYRHFANAKALLDGLSEQASAVMREHHRDGAQSIVLDDAARWALDLYRGFEAAGPALKAAIIAGLSEGYRSPGQPGRVDSVRQMLRAELPHLNEAELDQAVIMARLQLGGPAWYLLTQREGLSTEQAARLSARAVQAFVHSLRDDAAG